MQKLDRFHFFFAGLVFLGHLFLAGAAGAAGPDNIPTVDTNVINTPLNPVPVVVQGNEIGGEPLAVEVQEPLVVRQSLEPILRRLSRDIDCAGSGCPKSHFADIYTVPPGKNFLIDYVTFLDRTMATAPGGAASQLYLHITNPDSETAGVIQANHFIGNIAENEGTQDSVSRSQLGRNVAIAVGPGGKVSSLVTWFEHPFSGGLRYEVVISGRLVDAY